MGDIGQNELTEEQLDAIGEIDIAFMQFENSYSRMNLDNLKGFTMIEQVNPRIVIRLIIRTNPEPYWKRSMVP